MSPSTSVPHIAIVIYPDAQMSAVYGLTDLFAVADRLARQRLGTPGAVLRVSHFGADAAGRVPAPLLDTGGGDEPPDMVILPPSLAGPPSGEAAAIFVPWLRARHAAGATLASVCAGAFLLAATGLLAGRPATTHWLHARLLAERFPAIRIDADKLLIDDGDIITAGGLMAWTDLGLRLVDRLLGPAAMFDTARFLLIDPPGREQRYYSAFSPRLGHGDGAIVKVQHWLQSHGTGPMKVGALAALAGLEERTFLRRFRAATGLRPLEYCQHLRIGKARELLEGSNSSIEQIAWAVGYGDPASFRRLFLNLTGLTPSDYRRRFSATGAGPRAP